MSDFINADVDIGKFNTIIAIMRRCSVETRPVMAAVGNLVSYRGSLRAEGKLDNENLVRDEANLPRRQGDYTHVE